MSGFVSLILNPFLRVFFHFSLLKEEALKKFLWKSLTFILSWKLLYFVHTTTPHYRDCILIICFDPILYNFTPIACGLFDKEISFSWPSNLELGTYIFSKYKREEEESLINSHQPTLKRQGLSYRVSDCKGYKVILLCWGYRFWFFLIYLVISNLLWPFSTHLLFFPSHPFINESVCKIIFPHGKIHHMWGKLIFFTLALVYVFSQNGSDNS